MTPTRLYLIRHGETEANKNGILMGSTDVPLNEQGRLQALTLRERINALTADHIFCSPLQRAVETAVLIFGENAPIITDSSIQEYHFGQWEGKHFSEIAKAYPETWKYWLLDWEQTQIPEAEAFAAFKLRLIMFVDELLRYHQGKKLVLVSHGGCIRALLAHFFCASVASGYWKFKVENATLTEVEFMDQQPILIRFNYR